MAHAQPWRPIVFAGQLFHALDQFKVARGENCSAKSRSSARFDTYHHPNKHKHDEHIMMQCAFIILNMINLASSATVRYRAPEMLDFYNILNTQQQLVEPMKSSSKPTCGPIPFEDFSCEEPTTRRPIKPSGYGGVDDGETIFDTIDPAPSTYLTPSSTKLSSPLALRKVSEVPRPTPEKLDPMQQIASLLMETTYPESIALRTNKVTIKYKQMQHIRGTTSTMPPYAIPSKGEDDDFSDDVAPHQQKPKCGGLAACREQKWA